jgi:hypothetical protein
MGTRNVDLAREYLRAVESTVAAVRSAENGNG